MKKLRLNAFELEGAEILTREQLKKVLGGDGSGTGTDESATDDETTTSAGCATSCSKWTGGSTGSMKTGICTAGTMQVGTKSVPTCDCSIVGGTGC